ncbi:MAG: hypothetical protein ACYDDU_20250 [Dermatophilaceae bacterium]
MTTILSRQTTTRRLNTTLTRPEALTRPETLRHQATLEPGTSDTGAPTAIHIPLFALVAVVVVLLYITWAFAGVNIFPTTWNQLHEFFHDGRHFLGIPCH